MRAERVVAAVVGIVVLFTVLLLCEITFLHTNYYATGEVVDLQYEAAHSQTGVGVVNNPNGGGSTTVVTTSSEPEKWQVMIKTGDDVVTADATARIYYKLAKGQRVRYITCVGSLTHITYGRQVVE